MTETRRVVCGFLCAALIIFSLAATAGEALAAASSGETSAVVSRGPKDKRGDKDKPRDDRASVQPTGISWESAGVTWEALGVTWE